MVYGVPAELNLHRVLDGSGDRPCPLEDQDREDDSKSVATTLSQKTAKTVTTFRDGDSVADSTLDEEGSAIAVEKEKRSKPQPKDITPAQQRLQARWRARNDADHIGNIGWLFGNWGKRPANVKMRDHVDEVSKKQPAMAIWLAECQKETEMVLQREAAEVAAAPKVQAKRKFKYRPEFPYLQRPHCSARSGWLRLGVAESGALVSWAHQTEKAKARQELGHTLAASSRMSPCRIMWASSEKRALPWWCTCTTSSPIWS